jgi:hypothetical protein
MNQNESLDESLRQPTSRCLGNIDVHECGLYVKLSYGKFRDSPHHGYFDTMSKA